MKQEENEPVLSPEVVGGQYALSSITERHWTSLLLLLLLLLFINFSF